MLDLSESGFLITFDSHRSQTSSGLLCTGCIQPGGQVVWGDHTRNLFEQYVETRVLQNTYNINNSYNDDLRDCYSAFTHSSCVNAFMLVNGDLDLSIPLWLSRTIHSLWSLSAVFPRDTPMSCVTRKPACLSAAEYSSIYRCLQLAQDLGNRLYILSDACSSGFVVLSRNEKNDC